MTPTAFQDIGALAILAGLIYMLTRVAVEVVNWFMKRNEAKDGQLDVAAKRHDELLERVLVAMEKNAAANKIAATAYRENNKLLKRLNGRFTNSYFEAVIEGADMPKRREYDKNDKAKGGKE